MKVSKDFYACWVMDHFETFDGMRKIYKFMDNMIILRCF